MTEANRTEEERVKNRLEVAVVTELGCSIAEGEYSIYITKIVAGMIGEDDFGLVREYVEEHLEELALPAEGATGFILQETGEWDGFPHWMKYYELAERIGDLSHE